MTLPSLGTAERKRGSWLSSRFENGWESCDGTYDNLGRVFTDMPMSSPCYSHMCKAWRAISNSLPPRLKKEQGKEMKEPTSMPATRFKRTGRKRDLPILDVKVTLNLTPDPELYLT